MVNLNKLDKEIDELLDNETSESLSNYLSYYCWLRSDGEYSQSWRSEPDEFAKKEAKSKGWKLIKMREINY